MVKLIGLGRDKALFTQYVRIIPHATTNASIEPVIRMMDHLHSFRRPFREELQKGRVHFRYLIHRSKTGKLTFYLGFPSDRSTGILRMMKMLYPDVELEDITHDAIPLTPDPQLPVGLVGGVMNSFNDNRSGFSFKRYDGCTDFEDVLFSLGDEKDSEAWLDITVIPEKDKNIKSKIKASMDSFKNISSSSFLSDAGLSRNDFAAALRGQQKHTNKNKPVNISRDMSQEQKQQLKALEQRYTGRESVFAVNIGILCHGKYPDAQLQTIASTINHMFKLDNNLFLQKIRKYEGFVFSTEPKVKSDNCVIMTGPELGNVVRLPQSKHRIYERIPHIKIGQTLLSKDELTKGIHVGHMDHPVGGNDRSVKIPVKEILKHFVLTGQTGSGKSSMLMEIFDALISEFIEQPKNGVGFTLFDPAQETVASILNRLRHYEKIGKKVDWSKIHYFNFSREDYVLPMNLLYRRREEPIYNVSNEVLELITSAYGPAVRMERIVRNCLGTLMNDPITSHSILGMLPLLMDTHFRNQIVPKYVNDDYMLSQFWKNEFPALSETRGFVEPLLNRLSPFQTNADMRRMFGHHEMKLQIRKWMDEGHIVLFDIKGLSNQAIKLVGGYVANQYHKEAQTRSTGSRAHLLIYDEAHETQFPVLTTIQAKDRKHGLSLGLCTQFLEQFTPELVKSITENVGNIFSARQGPESGKIISRMTRGTFDQDTLQSLPDNRIAIYTWSVVNGEKRRATATVRCAPPYVYRPDGSGEWADYENEREMETAFKWGLQRGMALFKRDGISANEVDRSISHYLKTGRPLDNQEAAGEDQLKPKLRKW
ncbi:helicase HerA domain-containing protein [Paenibacillus macquariensis]|uniref:DNA helicase HerA, contains HAS-barrel and ATPase domains n=1 Tax=Paenibacillus macquariensis TaxID=948756 RepID=A0ABY1KEM3_9BACL|nr:DUF87 domain-containing protein [Paenibacillus macquariensis]OAB28464.1 hypothetical protein PMSM_24375 [Paenibacillus macquariensis subsp. macquariensis]SIR71861.1 DNA helicase HerA, contains HAS-barrel and ATPase domains [Paenibacillus macquariensis]